MIGAVIGLLRDQLNEHLASAGVPGESQEDPVVFLDGDKLDPVTFKLGAITAVLVNLEQDHSLRRDDPYLRIGADGSATRVAPELHINLYLLFVARFRQYEQALDQLAAVIDFFQAHRVFDHQRAPALDSAVEKLVVDLMTLPFSEQNEIWGALRTAYHPSVLYRVRLATFSDAAGVDVPLVAEAPPPRVMERA